MAHPIKLPPFPLPSGDSPRAPDSPHEQYIRSRTGTAGYVQWLINRWQRPREVSPRTLVDRMVMTSEAYEAQLQAIAVREQGSVIMRIFFTKALKELPLTTLVRSDFFWLSKNFRHICHLLERDQEKFLQLLDLTSLENFILYPGVCHTEMQVAAILEHALHRPEKLEGLIDIIFNVLGDTRNGSSLDRRYLYYLHCLILMKKESIVVERLAIKWVYLMPIAIEKLKQLATEENAIELLKVISFIESIPRLSLETLALSRFFWLSNPLEHVCKLLEHQYEKFQQLLDLTSADNFALYPHICRTQQQMLAVALHALKDPKKLEVLVDAILKLLGEKRPSINARYMFYMAYLIEKGSGAFIAGRLALQWKNITPAALEKLQKLENAPEVQKVMAENLSRP
jgi:hypothetical protein